MTDHETIRPTTVAATTYPGLPSPSMDAPRHPFRAPKRRLTGVGWVAVAVLALGACGGDSDEAPPAPTGSTADPQMPAATPLEDSLFDLDASKRRLVVPWKMGSITRQPSEGGTSVVANLELVRHTQGFDRLTVTLEPRGAGLGYELQFHEEPPTRCGSGEALEPVEGAGEWLTLRLDRAEAHDASGSPTLEARERSFEGTGNALGYSLICDFEGVVELAFPIRERALVRLIEMREPDRIVVELRHRAP